MVKFPQLVDTSASSLALGATCAVGGLSLTRFGFGFGACWHPAGREAEVEEPPLPQAVSASAERFVASSVPKDRAIGILRIPTEARPTCRPTGKMSA